MRFIVNKYIEASSVEEAIKKSKKTPIHEVFIHNDHWKENGFYLGNQTGVTRIGFKDENSKRVPAQLQRNRKSL